MQPHEDVDVTKLQHEIDEGIASGDCEGLPFAAHSVLTHRAYIDMLSTSLVEACTRGPIEMMASVDRLRADATALWDGRTHAMQAMSAVGVYWHLSGDYLFLYRFQPKKKRVQIIRVLTRPEIYDSAHWAGRVEEKIIMVTKSS